MKRNKPVLYLFLAPRRIGLNFDRFLSFPVCPSSPCRFVSYLFSSFSTFHAILSNKNYGLNPNDVLLQCPHRVAHMSSLFVSFLSVFRSVFVMISTVSLRFCFVLLPLPYCDDFIAEYVFTNNERCHVAIHYERRKERGPII